MNFQTIGDFLNQLNEAKGRITMVKRDLTTALGRGLTRPEMNNLQKLFNLSKCCKRHGYQFGVGRIWSSGTCFLALAKQFDEDITLISEIRQDDSSPRITRCVTCRIGTFYSLPLWPITQEELVSSMRGYLKDLESLPVLTLQIGSYEDSLNRLEMLLAKVRDTSL